MNIKTLIAAALASLLMAGSAFAMDSAAIEEHMQEISERTEKAIADDKKPRVKALEAQVKELEEMIRMMTEEGES